MLVLITLGALLCAGLFLFALWEERKQRDVLPPPRKDCVVNNWKYSGLPPR